MQQQLTRSVLAHHMQHPNISRYICRMALLGGTNIPTLGRVRSSQRRSRSYAKFEFVHQLLGRAPHGRLKQRWNYDVDLLQTLDAGRWLALKHSLLLVAHSEAQAGLARMTAACFLV